jgi:CubicO group peptidase (beta-lactamase class C family)
MHRSVIAASVLLSVAAASVQAQEASQARNAQVDSIFAQWDRADSPGCALGVYRGGGIVYARGYGMADLERQVPITTRSIFDIGSTSKQFAAASMVLLAQQGRLSLDDDVRQHIPELPVYTAPITIRQLLHHTSGLRDYIGLLTLAGHDIDDVTTPQEALDIIARQRELNFEPGSEHLYSNSGYFLLSIIVERVAGRSLRDFARTEIFDPLGMTRTQYLGSYDDVVADRALAYSPRAGGLRTDISRWLQLGDGAVFTNVEDLLHWDSNFLEPKVGGQALLEQLQTPGTLSSGAALSYALGLSIGEHRGQRTVSHGGSWGGYRAELIRFPDQSFSVALLCNLGTINPSQLATRVADVYLADVLAPARVAADRSAAGMAEAALSPAASSAAAAAGPVLEPDVLSALAAIWRDPSTRTVRTLVLDDGRLFLSAGSTRYELRPRSAVDFDLINAPAEVRLTFSAATDASPRTMTWLVTGQRPVPLHRLDIVTPSAAELAMYTGSFYSDELQANFHVAVENDDALMLRRPGAAPQALRPMERDEFAAGSMTLRFVRGANGEPSGFLLDLGRIRNLKFERVAAPAVR